MSEDLPSLDHSPCQVRRPPFHVLRGSATPLLSDVSSPWIPWRAGGHSDHLGTSISVHVTAGQHEIVAIDGHILSDRITLDLEGILMQLRGSGGIDPDETPPLGNGPPGLPVGETS